jgi:aerobic-type carbon monoxide dehydrogenase small subunit (CoxS/CutS family)
MHIHAVGVPFIFAMYCTNRIIAAATVILSSSPAPGSIDRISDETSDNACTRGGRPSHSCYVLY